MLFSMGAFVVLFVYGMVMATVMGGLTTAMSDLPTTILIALLGLFIASQRTPVVTRSDAQILVLYIATFLLATLALGGLILSLPPYFVFQAQSDWHGSSVSYSQGVSKFFGFGLVLCGFLLQAERSVKLQILLLFPSLTFLLLAFVGGGRGDALTALIIFLFVVMIRLPLKAKIPAIIIIVMLTGLFVRNINLDDLVIFRRLSIILEGSAGARDEIYAEAIGMLADKVQCAVIGCGFDYFQFALQQDVGRYPHNQLIESMIVWGIPLTLVTMSYTVIGLYKSFREDGRNDAFPFIALFFFFIAMKSGSVVSSWLFVISVFHYFGVGLDRALFPRQNQ